MCYLRRRLGSRREAGWWARGSPIFRDVAEVEKDICVPTFNSNSLPVRGLPMECHESGMSS